MNSITLVFDMGMEVKEWEKLKHNLGMKSHLIMMYDLYNVLMNSVGSQFVEDFCIYVHQGYWDEVSFSTPLLSICVCLATRNGSLVGSTMYGSCFLLYSGTLGVWIGGFNPFTFKVIIDKYVVTAILLIIFFLSPPPSYY